MAGAGYSGRPAKVARAGNGGWQGKVSGAGIGDIGRLGGWQELVMQAGQ